MSKKNLENFRNFIHSLGPGIIFAGSAIGVSHLVQSTRAGALYGYALVGFVLAANLFKFPFFEFGGRYANATGESLIEGYRRLGRGYFSLFAALTFATMWIVLATVSVVTVSVISSLFDPGISIIEEVLGLLCVCAVVLFFGKYRLLDRLMKGAVLVLSLSTIYAVIIAWYTLPTVVSPAFVWTGASIAFLISLMGWMPAPIDISVWSSLWTLAKEKKEERSLERTDLDFMIGYTGTVIMSLCFLSLGAIVMHGKNIELAESGITFSRQFLQMYEETLGTRARPIIFLSPFSAMSSTTLTVLDGYARVLTRIFHILKPEVKEYQTLYFGAIIVLISGVGFLLGCYSQKILVLINLATILSFLSNRY